MAQLTIETFLPQPEENLRLNDWIFANIQPYIIGRVFEMDSGTGTISSRLVDLRFTVQLNATDEINRKYLREKFQGEALVRGIHRINFSQPDLEPAYADFAGSFSTVIALNIIEHGFHAKNTFKKAKDLLVQGGHLIVATRSHIAFYPGWQQDIELIKNYDRKSIRETLSNCEILKTRYFDWNGLSVIAVGRKT